MKGREINTESKYVNDFKKKLTVQPFMPGAPVPIFYTMYKLTNKFMYVPRYFTSVGTLKLNEHKVCKIIINSKPREYQDSIIDTIHQELIKNDSCIACLYTGWGKTFAALYISHLLGAKTLIVVNKESLMTQWAEQITKFLGIIPGIIQGNNTDVEPDVCIGMIQSISMKDYTPETFKDFGLCIFDETHHYCSKVFSNVFYKIGTKFNLGLTATIKRADKLEYTLEWFLGKPAVNVQLLIIEPQIYIYKFYEYDDPIKFLPNGKVNSPASVTNITINKHRDQLILKLIKEYYACDRKILILTDRKAHCRELYNNLNNYSVGIYYGGMKSEELKKSNECKIIIGTYQMASEGYDNPELDTLILASPKINIEQAVGRILRKKNKNIPIVIDINDCISIFTNWNRKRQSFYNTKKFKVFFKNEETEETEETEDIEEQSTVNNYLFRD